MVRAAQHANEPVRQLARASLRCRALRVAARRGHFFLVAFQPEPPFLWLPAGYWRSVSRTGHASLLEAST